jgi:hypothetical protein
MKTIFTTALMSLGLISAQAQHENQLILFPNVPDYQTLVVDLHMHTVFSDGSVWPDIRVHEAVRDSVDLIAMTDHLEYQPHSEDIPHPNRNRSFEIAMQVAKNEQLMVINGAEITRSMPPGHSNAVFLEDANALLVEDPVEAFRAARKQDAFAFWNHPMWTAQYSDGVAKLTDLHRQLIEEDLLHGIEVVNMNAYSQEALQIALDHDLTILGTSDVHGLVSWNFELQKGGHRPVTLVFAEERSVESIKAALFAGRTVAYFNKMLIGKKEYMEPLLAASAQVVAATYPRRNQVIPVTIANRSCLELTLQNQSEYTFQNQGELISLPPFEETVIEVRTLEKLESFELPFKVLNAVIAPETYADLILRVEAEQ